MLSIFLQIWLLLFPIWSEGGAVDKPDEVYIRINQVGYLADELKSAILFSNAPVREKYAVIHAESGQVIYTARPARCETEGWGAFDYYYIFDFTRILNRDPISWRERSREAEVRCLKFLHTPMIIFRRSCLGLCASNAAGTIQPWTGSVTSMMAAPFTVQCPIPPMWM